MCVFKKQYFWMVKIHCYYFGIAKCCLTNAVLSQSDFLYHGKGQVCFLMLYFRVSSVLDDFDASLF